MDVRQGRCETAGFLDRRALECPLSAGELSLRISLATIEGLDGLHDIKQGSDASFVKVFLVDA